MKMTPIYKSSLSLTAILILSMVLSTIVATSSNTSFTCPQGEYKVEIPGRDPKCYPCKSSCKTCTEFETCSTCKQDYSLNKNGHCELSQCPKGQFLELNVETKKCQFCLSSCSECLSKNQCLDCVTHYSLTKDGRCIKSSCPKGEYINTENISEKNPEVQCALCPNKCSECSNYDTCTSCKDNYALSGSECKPSAPLSVIILVVGFSIALVSIFTILLVFYGFDGKILACIKSTYRNCFSRNDNNSSGEETLLENENIDNTTATTTDKKQIHVALPINYKPPFQDIEAQKESL